MSVTLSTEEFTTLVAWAEQHGLSQGWSSYAAIRDFIEKIERTNNLARQFLALRWKDRNTNPYSPQYVDDWPPTLRLDIMRYTTPWTYDEIMEMITNKTTHPFGVEVTVDRMGVAGWTDIDTFFGRP